MSKKLTRNLNDKMLAGVAAGIADYFQLEVTWVRIAFVLATFFGGGGLWIYIILWIAVPENSFSTIYEPSVNNDSVFSNLNKRKRSKEKINGSLIGGLIMIALGSYFLLDEFNIIPDWFNVGKLWPLIFVFIGLSILFKGAKQEAAAKEFDTSDFKKYTDHEPVKHEEEKPFIDTEIDKTQTENKNTETL